MATSPAQPNSPLSAKGRNPNLQPTSGVEANLAQEVARGGAEGASGLMLKSLPMPKVGEMQIQGVSFDPNSNALSTVPEREEQTLRGREDPRTHERRLADIAALARAGGKNADNIGAPSELASSLQVLSLPERIARDLAAVGLNPVSGDDSNAGDGMPHMEMVRGTDFKLFALWPVEADKENAPYAALWQVIDGSTWSAVPTAMRLKGEMDRALNDENLSPLGRRAAVVQLVRADAATALQRLGRRWLAARNTVAELGQDLAGVESYSTARPWQWALDIEAGRSMRALDDEQRRMLVTALALGEFPDLAESLLRLPPSLTGVSSGHLARIRSAVIERTNPGAGWRELVRSAAVTAAASAITTFYRQVTSGGWVDRSEFHKLIGAEACEALVHCGATIAELVMPLPMVTGAAIHGGPVGGADQPAPL